MAREGASRAGGAALLLLVAAIGCSGARHATTTLASTPPDAASTHDLMSTEDHARLAVLAEERTERAADGGYRIGPDDLLEIRIPDLVDARGVASAARSGDGALPGVAGTPTFQEGVRVSAQGTITVPLLGAVRVEGMRPAEAEADLARRLIAADILRAPHVSVQVVEYRARVVAVTGSVERPGVYPVTRPGATIADMIAAAGGPSKDAGRLVAFVPARCGGAAASTDAPVSPACTAAPAGAESSPAARAPIRIDLDALLRATGSTAPDVNPPVRAGDAITLAPAGSVLVDGWVEKPGAYPVTRGLTVAGAIAAAGGKLFPADRQSITVTRVVAGAQHVTTVDLGAVADGRATDVPVTDGDVVEVPAATTRLVPWGLWSVAKEMVHIGGSVLLF